MAGEWIFTAVKRNFLGKRTAMDTQPRSSFVNHYWPLFLPIITFTVLSVSVGIWMLSALHPELPFWMALNPYTPFPTALFLGIELFITLILLIRARRKQKVAFRRSAPLFAVILLLATSVFTMAFNPVGDQGTLWLSSTEASDHRYHLLLPGGYTFGSEFVLIECDARDIQCELIHKVLSYTVTNVCLPLSDLELPQ